MALFIVTAMKPQILQVFINFKKANDAVRKEVLYSIVIEFDLPIKLIRIFKI
jgi:hypothetical protein